VVEDFSVNGSKRRTGKGYPNGWVKQIPQFTYQCGAALTPPNQGVASSYTMSCDIQLPTLKKIIAAANLSFVKEKEKLK
jgi:hypothetical protein